jgi:hypothetical protein
MVGHSFLQADILYIRIRSAEPPRTPIRRTCAMIGNWQSYALQESYSYGQRRSHRIETLLQDTGLS